MHKKVPETYQEGSHLLHVLYCIYCGGWSIEYSLHPLFSDGSKFPIPNKGPESVPFRLDSNRADPLDTDYNIHEHTRLVPECTALHHADTKHAPGNTILERI